MRHDFSLGTYTVGSIIEYNSFGGDSRRVRVTNRDSNIKNGRAGFDGVVLDETGTEVPDMTVWGYDDQITRIVSLTGK